MERLSRRCQSLADFPERGRAYGPRYRAVNEGSYVIIYRVDPARRRVASRSCTLPATSAVTSAS